MNWDQAVDAFAEIGGYPTDEMAWVLEEWETTGPACHALLHGYVSGADLSERTERALFFVIPMLGEKADTGAFPDLCQLAMDAERSNTVLGEDAASEMLPPVLLSTFDGDRAALHRLVETPAVDEFLRGDALLALAYLARTRRFPESELYEYLAGLPDRLDAAAGEFVWFGWVRVVAAMGFAGLSGRAEQIFRDKLIDPRAMSPADFWAELRISQEDPHGMSSDMWFGAGPMGSAIDWIDAFTAVEDEVEERPEPIRNPLRNVGRNDPCPCGSGKKYKKCCLAA